MFHSEHSDNGIFHLDISFGQRNRRDLYKEHISLTNQVWDVDQSTEFY